MTPMTSEREKRVIDTSKGFTIVRTFTATPEEVWRAWTDADAIAQWWHPRGAHTPRESVEVDLRIGGRYVYSMVNNDTGDSVVSGGVYREIEPFTRLVFTWGYPDGDQDDQPIATVELEAVPEGTRQTFDLRGVEGAPGDGYFYDGWVGVLDVLGDYLD